MKLLHSRKLACGMTIAASIALSTPAHSATDAGKAIYNDSCVHCHGAGGAGNTGQDQFWRMRIPRLNEEYAQKKSDEELRDVILNGKRKMPPAVLGKPHTANNTKVKPEQVPDLIAYIRSLKRK